MPNQFQSLDTQAIRLRYEPKTRVFRQYVVFYAIASLCFAILWGATSSILLPLHVQQLEFSQYFTGSNAHVNLQKLSELQANVAANKVQPTADQREQLKLVAQYNTGKSGSLSLVTSISIFITMLLQPIVGTLSDRTRSRWGRRIPWIVGGAVTGGALIALMPLVPTIAVMVILWSVAQALGNAGQAALSPTVADRVPQNRIGLVSMIAGSVSYFGAVAGAVVAGSLFNAIGLGAYFPLAILMVVGVIIFALVSRDKSSRDLAVRPLRASTILSSFVTGLRDRDYRWAWFAKVILAAGWQLSIVYSVYILQSYVRPALSASEAATTSPLISLAGVPAAIIAMLISGRWSDKIGRRKPFVIAASVIMAVAFLIPLISPTLPALFLESIVMSFGFGMFIVIDLALFIDILPDQESAGRDLGLSQLGMQLGQTIGPVIAGAVVAIFAGNYGPIWPVASVLVLASAFMILPIKRAR